MITPEEAAVTVEVASDKDVEMAVTCAAEDAGVSVETLRAEAASGRFQSDEARLAWFAISPFFD
jgi:hypothetical protein